jgi:tRNA (cmo5U34)-methyltransferase
VSDSAASIFHAQAAGYDALRRRLIPPFEALYATAVQALCLADRPPRRVLDLGAGTGLLSSLVQREYPDAELVLLDGAPAMLEQARGLLGAGATFYLADLRDPLPGEDFDAVISALAIHHLEDPDKRALFARIHDALRPGGVFVNAEQVAAPSDRLDLRYRQWHEQSSLALGASPAEWAAAERRMTLDRCSTVEAQLAWLQNAGLTETDCLFKRYRFAVLFARRASNSLGSGASCSRASFRPESGK